MEPAPLLFVEAVEPTYSAPLMIMREEGFRRLTTALSVLLLITALVFFGLRLSDHNEYVRAYERQQSPRDLSSLARDLGIGVERRYVSMERPWSLTAAASIALPPFSSTLA